MMGEGEEIERGGREDKGRRRRVRGDLEGRGEMCERESET